MLRITRLSELFRDDSDRKSVQIPLIAAEPDALVASVIERENKRLLTRLVRIKGTWKTDPGNRLVFEATHQAPSKKISFDGEWSWAGQQLVYKISQTPLKTKLKREQELTFKGRWDVSKTKHLSYVLTGGTEAVLRLRGGWKYSERLGLLFELEKTRGRASVIRFGGNLRLDDKHRLSIDLTNRHGRPLGIELALTRDMVGGNTFLRLKRSAEESLAETGVSFRW